MAVRKMGVPNGGIKCIVNTCHYYMEGDGCGAERIEVRPQNASNSEDTDCATFLPEKGESAGRPKML